MIRLVWLILFCTLICGALSTEVLDKIDTEILIVDDIEKFKALNPYVVLQEMERTDLSRSRRIYSIGRRASGDRLVGGASQSFRFSSATNYRLVMRYPAGGGNGAVLSFVSVDVNQSSIPGRFFVSSGGIRQRFITVVVEADRTTFFTYTAQFFGN